jgi:hypothetical protein
VTKVVEAPTRNIVNMLLIFGTYNDKYLNMISKKIGLFVLLITICMTAFSQIDIDIEDIEPSTESSSSIGDVSFLMSLSHEEWIGMPHSVDLLKPKNYEFNMLFLVPFRDGAKTFNVHSGLSMSFSNLHSNVSDWEFIAMEEDLLPSNYPLSFDYTKNRVVAGYIGVPLGISFKFGPSNKKLFMMNLGVNSSLLFFTNNKLKFDNTKIKVKIREHLTPYRFNAYTSIGWRYIQLYGSYGLSPFFNRDTAPCIRNWATGVAVYF